MTLSTFELCSMRPNNEELKLLESQIAVALEEKEASAFEWDACNAIVGCFQALLGRFRDVCNHVAKRLNDKELRLEWIVRRMETMPKIR